MNIIEACKEIKTKYNTVYDIKCFLISKQQGPVEDNVRLCIKVEDGFISLSPFPITIDDMLSSNWELRIVYKKDVS